MAKEFDKELLNKTVISIVGDTFQKLCRAKFSADPVVLERDIIEFDGRLSVSPMEKFDAPAYAGVVNFFLSQKDLTEEVAVGMFVLIIKEEIMEKFSKAMGRSSRDSEDDEIMLDVCGEMTNILAGNLKNELVSLGYAELVLSTPSKYRNTIRGGVLFDYSLYQKQEIIFSFWNQKSVAIEVCMGAVPLKGRS
ncbi:MAG: chemotaxis protein CheX [Candidatus Omnitrophica bacterium]|nr:chemotaxis protein CheX [Candidatus Omnitrophota bacterium]